MAEVALPVDTGDAVSDEGVSGGGVGYAQQRLGEAEQSDAFACAQAIFAQEVGDIGTGRVRGTGGTDQGTRAHGDPHGQRRWESGGVEQGAEHGWLGGPVLDA